MIALYIALAALALLVILLALPIRFVITCREGVTLKLRILCFGLTLFPKSEETVRPQRYTVKFLKKKQRRAEKKAQRRALKKAKKAAAKKAVQPQDKQKAPLSLKEKLVLVRVLSAALLKKTKKHLTLTAARLHVRVATGDAATTAILYGAVSASLSYLLLALDRATRLRAKPRDVSVTADYLAERSSADIKLVFTMRVGGAIALALSLAVAFVRSKLTAKATRRKNTKKQKQALKPTA